MHAFANESAEFTLINRTNTPLERFNRHLNEKFPGHHPSMVTFMNGIKEISKEYVSTLDRIQKGTKEKPPRNLPSFCPIPQEYTDFNFDPNGKSV